jgi:hypothetical protein
MSLLLLFLPHPISLSMLCFNLCCLRNFLNYVLISSLTQCLFMLHFFSLHIFANPSIFLLLFLHSLLMVRKVLGMISIFLNLLRLILWSNMWSILENVPCALWKNVHCSFCRWKVLLISTIWSVMLFSQMFLCWFFFWMLYPLLWVGYWSQFTASGLSTSALHI